MDPSVVVAASEPPKPFLKFPNKKVVFSFLTIFIIILAVGAVFVLKNKSNTTNTVTAPKPRARLSAKEDLEQTIKQTFTDPKDKDIVKFVSFASSDRTLKTKFVDYNKAYQLIYQRYQNSATIPIKKALIKLRTYLRPFPQFKEADFKLPK